MGADFLRKILHVVTEAENPSLKAALKMIAANQKEKPREPEEQLSVAEGAMLVLDRLVGPRSDYNI